METNLLFQMKGHRPNSNTLAIPVPPDKEPAGRRSSGLAHLMSALHQNAAAVVNSKTQLNGPDQVKNSTDSNLFFCKKLTWTYVAGDPSVLFISRGRRDNFKIVYDLF